MQINKNVNLSSSETLAKGYQTPVSANSEQKQQAELVSSEASQASRAYATAQIGRSKNVNFEGKYEKLMETIKTTTNPSKVHLSFDEASNILARMGYNIESGKGSHYTVNIPNARPLTIVKPHGNHDYIHPETIKSLRTLLNQ
jgi:predicted RNA binding protein YcfA (HicA-like mRNA interferase family)